MHWTDLLIIYLSCGAPFGVYFFLQNREKMPLASLLLRSGAAVLGWIAYAYMLRRKKIEKGFTRDASFSSDPEIALLEQQTAVLQEQVLQEFIALNSKNKLQLHFFTFRDVLERYAGLTLAVKADENTENNTVGESDFEIFRIAGRKKKELPLAGKCLARKQSMRLKQHQSKASEDFLKELANLAGSVVQVKENGPPQSFSSLRDLILELLELLDVKLMEHAEEIFTSRETAGRQQTNNEVTRLTQAAARN